MKPDLSKKTKHLILAMIPFILAIAIMTPRLISAQFALLDDAVMLSRTTAIRQGDFSLSEDLQSGRFRPVYWIFYTVISRVGSANSAWFYFAYLLLLVLILLELRILLKIQEASPPQILITSLLFLLSIPIIENFYTLSKGEPLQLAFLLGTMIGFEKLKQETRLLKRFFHVFCILLCILLAMMVKETSIIIAFFALCLTIIFWLQNKPIKQKELRDYLLLLGAALSMVLLFFAVRSAWGTPAISEGSYTNRYTFSINAIATSIGRWLVLLSAYFHYFIPAGIMILFAIIWNHPKEKHIQNVTSYWGIWCLLWLAVLSPWQFAEAYYLLPFSLGLSIITGVFIQRTPLILKSVNKTKQLVMLCLLTLSLVLFALSLTNYLTHARMQLTIDRINWDMLTEVADNIPHSSRVRINILVENEYTDNIGQFLKIWFDLKDLSYRNIKSYEVAELDTHKGTFILMPNIDNEPKLSVRSGIVESTQDHWNKLVMDAVGDQLQLVAAVSDSFHLTNVNLPVLLCPLIGPRSYCQDPDPIIDLRLLKYEWKVYKIK